MASPTIRSNVQPIYEMHRRWLSDALSTGSSLLTPGVAIWTPEHLDELDEHFIGHPDLTKDKRFLEKLHDQLASVSPGSVQLMAELHVVHFLIIWNGAISAAKKLRDLDAILSWMPMPCAVPDDIARVMAPGIVHPGQWVMSRRDTQLTWLIRFSRTWTEQPKDRQRAMIDDPWAMRSFVETIEAPTADSARLTLLHLSHPATFEAIVSLDHKRLIAKRFTDLWGDEEDIDRRLLATRAALTPTYGEGFDWYADPLVHRWQKDPKAWSAFLGQLRPIRAMPEFDREERDYKLELAEKIRTARDQVLSGGDGWFDALRGAVRNRLNNLTSYRAHEPFLRWLDEDRAGGLHALRTLWSGDHQPVERLQSFLELIPAVALGPRGERINIGSFLLMAEDATSLPPMKISTFVTAWKTAGWGPEPKDLEPAQVYQRILVFLDELVHDSAGWELPLRDRLDAQGATWALIYEAEKGEADQSVESGDGRPLSESSVAPLTDHIADAATDLHVDREVLDEMVELLEDKRQIVLYGPPGTGKTYLALRLARAIVEGDEARTAVVQFHPATSYEDFFEGLRPKVTEAGQVTYERTDGPLADMAAKAAGDPDRKYLLIIDEINRANLPKVFGELLFLLEYRTREARTLYRPKEPFRLPPNLWFIGTMNTSDRSIALIDAAMRRRFHFVPFFPHEGPMKGLLGRWLKSRGGRLGVAEFLDRVNADLLDLLGEHLLIGPSHFMKADLSERALERIWTYNVFPLIEEQLWGNRDEVDRWRWQAVRKRFDHALAVPSVPAVVNLEHEVTEGEDDEPNVL